ncbi:hypothetical protein Emed_001323 [Eimeria media]
MKGVRERRQASSQQRHAGHSSKRSSGRPRHEETEASTAESFEATAEAEAATIKGRPMKRWPSKGVLAILIPTLVMAMIVWCEKRLAEEFLSVDKPIQVGEVEPTRPPEGVVPEMTEAGPLPSEDLLPKEPGEVGEGEPTGPSGAAVPKTPEVEPVPSEEFLSVEPGEAGDVKPTRPSEVEVPGMPKAGPLPPELQRKLDALIAWAREAPVSEGKILPVWDLQKKAFEEVVVRNFVTYTLSAKYLTPPATNDPDKVNALGMVGRSGYFEETASFGVRLVLVLMYEGANMAALLLKGVSALLEECTPNEERVRTIRNEFLRRDALFGDMECGQVLLSIEMKRD